jgi:hypothetical protein
MGNRAAQYRRLAEEYLALSRLGFSMHGLLNLLEMATPQRAPPEVDEMVPEHVQCPRIGRHCVVVEVAADDVPQPLSLFGDWLMHAPPHLRFDHLELRMHAVSPGFPFDLEFALPRCFARICIVLAVFCCEEAG